ncbi:MAG: hypothetical protein IKM00_00740 [Clostridia bacterium]|nr:hypothetical protein [Clostridia bacterium]
MAQNHQGADDGRRPFRYTFLNQTHTDVSSLVRALAAHWKEGKAELSEGSLSEGFAPYDAEAASLCRQAERDCVADPQDDDWIFLDLLYRLDKGLKTFFKKGTPYSDLKVLGREILKDLREGDFSECRFWNGLLRKNILSDHGHRLFREAKSAKIASVLEGIGDPDTDDERTQILNTYAVGYFLANEISFVTDGKTVKTVPQLTQYMNALLDISYEALAEFCHTLIDYDNVPDVQLEAFLLACGKKEELAAWRADMD